MKTSEQKSPLSEEQKSPASKRKPNFSKPYAAIAVVAVLAALATAGWFLLYGDGNGANESSAQTDATAGETAPIPPGSESGTINMGE